MLAKQTGSRKRGRQPIFSPSQCLLLARRCARLRIEPSSSGCLTTLGPRPLPHHVYLHATAWRRREAEVYLRPDPVFSRPDLRPPLSPETGSHPASCPRRVPALPGLKPQVTHPRRSLFPGSDRSPRLAPTGSDLLARMPVQERPPRIAD